MSAAASAGAPLWMRRLHRWVSIAFTLAVIANFVALGLGVDGPTGQWIGASAVPPLLLLLPTGLYLFILPYTKGARRVPSTEAARAS